MGGSRSQAAQSGRISYGDIVVERQGAGHGRLQLRRSSSNAELFDPVTQRWTVTGTTMNFARCRHTATLLPNGKVLVAGGEGASLSAVSSAELYDPVTGTWSVTGSMNNTREDHTATLLSNGKVLVAGGYSIGTSYLGSAELYDPGHWYVGGYRTNDGYTGMAHSNIASRW